MKYSSVFFEHKWEIIIHPLPSILTKAQDFCSGLNPVGEEDNGLSWLQQLAARGTKLLSP